MLKRMKDNSALYELVRLSYVSAVCTLCTIYLPSQVGTAIIEFMKRKSLPFPNALLSKRHFRRVPAWKRAMLFIRLIRHVLGTHSNNHWNNFSYENYRSNTSTRVFDYYCSTDEQTWDPLELQVQYEGVWLLLFRGWAHLGKLCPVRHFAGRRDDINNKNNNPQEENPENFWTLHPWKLCGG